MKVSIVMIDGGFRENTFGVEYFSKQRFPEDEYEIIWVDYYDRVNPRVAANPKVTVMTLNKSGIYHSSYCFNRGIREARGELIVIPDADQIVPWDFISRVWDLHREYDELVAYGYRHDEAERGALQSFDFDELERKCVLKNPVNYGGCLTVRKKWLVKVNGYEQHPLFRTGNHANGLDMYTRFKNLGLAIRWEPTLKLYHPWHSFTLMGTEEHEAQKRIITWRSKNLQWQAFRGLDPARDIAIPEEARVILNTELEVLDEAIRDEQGVVPQMLREKVTQPMPRYLGR
jgi:hypothetical protein